VRKVLLFGSSFRIRKISHTHQPIQPNINHPNNPYWKDTPYPMNEIDITGLDKAELFAALYNAAEISRPNGWYHAMEGLQGNMTAEEARRHFFGYRREDEAQESNPSLLSRLPSPPTDELYGRYLHFDIWGDSIDPTEYDQHNGPGKMAEVVEELRRTGRIVPPPKWTDAPRSAQRGWR
jgi:hypothetical protein